jgi:hypothetical protein
MGYGRRRRIFGMVLIILVLFLYSADCACPIEVQSGVGSSNASSATFGPLAFLEFGQGEG